MNFKEQLYLKILDNEQLHTNSVRQRILEEVLVTKKSLDNEQLELDDWIYTEKDDNITLSQAVEKLAHDLDNYPHLRQSYREALMHEMVMLMSEFAEANTEEQLHDLFRSVANSFIHRFIKDVNFNKKQNE